MGRDGRDMTYREIHDIVICSSLDDWLQVDGGLVYMPDIDINLEYSLFDPEVTEETNEIKGKFDYYQSGSKYRLLYRGGNVGSGTFVSDGTGLSVCAVPYPLSYVDKGSDETVCISVLEHKICYMISSFTCPINEIDYNKVLDGYGIEVRPYREGTWEIDDSVRHD